VNPGILTSGYAPPPMPHGLLGRPTLVPMIDGRAYDADAMAWINAVQAADGRPLERGVCVAVNEFVLGCKADSIWNAIGASCILMGARTLAGALVPLVGPSPTNVGPFVSGDYNRRTGLVGNGTSKYLNTNRNHNLDPQNNHHAAVFATTAPITGGNFPSYIGAGSAAAGVMNIGRFSGNGSLFFRSRTANASLQGNGSSTGLIGVARSIGSNYVARFDGANVTITEASSTPYSGSVFVFATSQDANPSALETVTASNARIAFFSVGRFLSLSLLERRVTTMQSAIGAAI
jgi:hypothetical protein